MKRKRPTAPRKIVIVAPPCVTLQDLTGPHEVFCRAARHAPGAYAVRTAACGRSRLVASKFGLELRCDLRLREVELPLDTLVVAGSDAATDGPVEPAFLDWLRQAAAQSRRTVSV